MDIYLLSHVIVFGVLVLLSMYFSAVETSLLSYPRALLESKAELPGLLGSAFKEWKNHPNRILTTILLGNNAVNVVITTLAAYMAIHFAEINHWNRVLMGTVASATVVIVLVVFGEAVPKVTARIHSAAVTPWLVIPIYLFDKLLSPVSWVLARVVSQLFPNLGEAS